MKVITDEMREQLRAPFPAEAMSRNDAKKFLTSIKAQYIIERLNNVFGVGIWKMTDVEILNHYEEVRVYSGKEKTCYIIALRANLRIDGYGICIPQFGGGSDPEIGDAYKGALTDATTKAASWLEVGNDVFKGLVKAPGGSAEEKSNDDRPWLTEAQKKAMLAEIAKGNAAAVVAKMNDYRMKKVWRTEIENALQNGNQ